jgi:hypothetical protein
MSTDWPTAPSVAEALGLGEEALEADGDDVAGASVLGAAGSVAHEATINTVAMRVAAVRRWLDMSVLIGRRIRGSSTIPVSVAAVNGWTRV